MQDGHALDAAQQRAYRVLDPDDGESELVSNAADERRGRVDLTFRESRRHFVEQQEARPRAERHADLEQALARRRQRTGHYACRLLETEEAEYRPGVVECVVRVGARTPGE